MNGLQVPSSNFNQSRSGLRTLAIYRDIDLSVARTTTGIGANAPLIFNDAGNCYYQDANPMDGVLRVRFQDTNFDRAAPELYSGPGAIFNLPFTQVAFTNAAQPGKIARIVYGVDIDFQPGSVAQVAFTGNVNLNGAVYNGTFFSQTMVAGANQIIAPASNVSGIILNNLTMSAYATAGGKASILAKSSAPASISDGDALGCNMQITSGTNIYNFQLINPLFIPAGKGLYARYEDGTVFGSQIHAASWQQ